MHHAIVANGEVQDVKTVLDLADLVSKKHGVTVQLFDADAVYNQRHLETAILHAERAFQEGRNAAKSLGAEILLYAAGERQVQRAIEAAGIRVGSKRTVILGIGYRCGAAIWELLDRLHWSKDPRGLQENVAALQRHGIVGLNGKSELAVLERVALVDLQK